MPELAESKKNQGGDGATLAAMLEKKSERIPYEVVEEERIPGSRVRFKLKLTEEAIAKRLDETVGEFSKQVRIDGFRPGKAPKHLVRARFEAPAREETVKRIVPRLAELFAEEKKLEAISQPYLIDFTSKKGEGTTVELALEVHPEVSVSGDTLNDLAVEAHRIAVDDSYVAQALEKMRERAATYEASEEGYQPKDGVLLSCTVTDTQGQRIDDRCASNHYSTNVEAEMPEAVAAALVGKKKGEKLSLDVTEEVEGADPGTLETVHYDVEVHEVKRRVLPALDDEFAKDLSDKFNTLEDLRSATRENAAKEEEARQRGEALDAVYAKLRNRLEFDLPRGMVDNTANKSINEMEERLNGYGISLRQMDEQVVRSYAKSVQDQAKVNVKNYLILRAISRFLNVTPTEDQITAALEEAAKPTGRKALALRAQLEARKQWPQFIEDLTLKITNDELLKKANVSYTDISAEDWAKKQQEAQEKQAAKLRGEGE